MRSEEVQAYHSTHEIRLNCRSEGSISAAWEARGGWGFDALSVSVWMQLAKYRRGTPLS